MIQNISRNFFKLLNNKSQLISESSAFSLKKSAPAFLILNKNNCFFSTEATA
jgi:hypothetical protein